MTTTEALLTALATIAVGGSGLTALLNYFAGGRKVRRETENQLWERLVTERTRAENERDQAEADRDDERAYTRVLERALAVRGIDIPDRPQRARTTGG
ncbi:hypothetical protein ACFQHV_00935 [Promicromonospora thailandica]|uniref:Uncharacterized protein n=1 Tax=Promicromonospora thailandica TaxID=765201 RepID=A0A9X2GBR6_9MICO|nr:hypothetical protein [Promicromonospora thailandica]MCP2265581.1 hypothetical protein [Promicromonospora thailandica]